MAARKPPPPPTTTRARDGCVVDTSPLAQVIAGFVSDWNLARGRPDRSHRRFGLIASVSPPEEDVALGALRWLSDETHRRGFAVPVKTIQNIARLGPDGRPSPRNRTTELRIADALVAVIERPDLFHNGTLTIRPNPLASREARASCC